MFAITAASMLAVVGLLYSFGVTLSQRRALQTAADAASLGGTWQVLRELASDNRSDSAVTAEVVQFATTNGVPSDGSPADTTYISALYVDASGASVTPTTLVGSGGAFPTAARGVRVTVKNQIPAILPGFLSVWQVLVQDSAASTARPTLPPPAASLVLPIAVSVSDARAAYSLHSSYDLFAHTLPGGQPPSLNLAASGAPSFGPMGTNMQYWSDGQHSGSWLLGQPGNVSLAGAGYFAEIAAGLRDNVRRQALPPDASGAPYALVTAPVYDTSTSMSVHVVGFVELKIRAGDISATSTRGVIVPYVTAAWGTPVAPSPDLGAALIGIVS